VKRAASERGLRVVTPEKLKPFVEDARALGADAFVVASYGKIVPQALLDVVPIAFNVHPSLLPLYRGATPIQSAIRDGRTETGVTIIAMDAGMDTGDVLLQEGTPIGQDETYGELHDRLAQRGSELVADALDRYANGSLRRTPQSEVARRLGIGDEQIARTLTRPLRKDDLSIDWSAAPEEIVRLVRSLSPQPLARTTYGLDSLKIIEVRPVTIDELAREVGGALMTTSGGGLLAGGIASHARCYAVPAAHVGAVVVDRLIAPNRGPMSGEAYARSVLQRFEKSDW
jgi:methionyl-tRNA formyltransferase